jgi:hypothetical protein
VLTEGSDWLEKQHRGVEGGFRAAGTGRGRGRSCCRGPPGSWTPRVDSWCSCGGAIGVKRVGSHRRRGIEVAEKITGGNVRCNSGATRVGVASGKLGKLPGGEAKLMRALAGSGVQQSGWSMVE